jgi:hypothetical protein
MSNNKGEVEIVIAPDGSTTLSVKGVKGAGCKALTEGIERALGSVIEDRETEEYREKPQQTAARNLNRQ